MHRTSPTACRRSPITAATCVAAPGQGTTTTTTTPAADDTSAAPQSGTAGTPAPGSPTGGELTATDRSTPSPGTPAVARTPDRPGGPGTPGTPGTPDSGTPDSAPPWLAYTGLNAERLVGAAVVLLLLGALARGLALGWRRRHAANAALPALG